MNRNEIPQSIKQQKTTKLVLKHWGIININNIKYDDSNTKQIVSIEGTFEKADKNTPIKYGLNWIADNGLNNLVPVGLFEKDNANTSSHQDEYQVNGYGESGMRLLSVGDVMNVSDKGLYKLDRQYLSLSSASRLKPAILTAIPDPKPMTWIIAPIISASVASIITYLYKHYK